MKFGFSLPHYRHLASTEAITRFAKEAEDMGYDSVWVTDQIIVPNSVIDDFGPVFYESLTVLAYLAGVTSTISLGSSVIVLPYRNPIYLAKVASSIDSLSHGRLILGVGVGGVEAEFKQISVSWEDRGDLSDEAIRIFQELWTSENPSIKSKNYQFSEIQFYPKPVQKPHLPLWIGGNTRRALRRVVEFGDVWHPSRMSLDMAAVSGVKMAMPEMTLDLLAERTPQLWRLAERAGRDPQEIGIAVREPLKFVSDPTLYSEAWPLLGTVAQVIGNVGRFRDAGVGHLVMDTFYGITQLHDETEASILATMERFATEVMPKFPEA